MTKFIMCLIGMVVLLLIALAAAGLCHGTCTLAVQGRRVLHAPTHRRVAPLAAMANTSARTHVEMASFCKRPDLGHGDGAKVKAKLGYC